MKTGKNAKMTTVGVLWGFRGREELAAFHPEFLLEKPQDILKEIAGDDTGGDRLKYFKKTRRKRVEAWLIAAMFLFGSLTGCASVRDTHGNVGTPGDGKLKVVTTLFPYYDLQDRSPVTSWIFPW